jgi:hypothetical protein
MQFTSPRSTVLHHTELLSPICTSPMTWQEGWRKMRSPMIGEVPRYEDKDMSVAGA